MKKKDLLQAKVKKIDRPTANDFFARFEILGDVGLGVWHWGLYLDEVLLSVVSFGMSSFGGKRGWIADLADSHGVDVLQLCRGGTIPFAPKGTPSRAISLSIGAMRKIRGPFIAVAYSDESLGEIGTIYQASGAYYSGMTDPKGQANYRINGRILSAWTVRKKYGTRDRKQLAKLDLNVEVIPLEPKHRYLLVSAPKVMRRKIVSEISDRSIPYPKRKICT